VRIGNGSHFLDYLKTAETVVKTMRVKTAELCGGRIVDGRNGSKSLPVRLHESLFKKSPARSY